MEEVVDIMGSTLLLLIPEPTRIRTFYADRPHTLVNPVANLLLYIRSPKSKESGDVHNRSRAADCAAGRTGLIKVLPCQD
jgi:hypothetical protein